MITSLFSWSLYTKKMGAKIEKPRFVGFFTDEEAARRGMFLAIGREGSLEKGNQMALYCLVDPEDGVISDVKFQVFGDSPLIAALEAACEVLLRKNYDQAKRITAELIDKQLRDVADEPAFPPTLSMHLNAVLEAIEKAAASCSHLPLPEMYTTPVPSHGENKEKGGYPNFLEFPHEQKLQIIEDVFNEEIRPYVELDAGGVKIVDLNSDNELVISYQGNCTSCFSAIGATLSTIQQIVQSKIHPSLAVVPNMDDLKF